ASSAALDEIEALRLEIEALRKSLQATRKRVEALESQVQARNRPGLEANKALTPDDVFGPRLDGAGGGNDMLRQSRMPGGTARGQSGAPAMPGSGMPGTGSFDRRKMPGG